MTYLRHTVLILISLLLPLLFGSGAALADGKAFGDPMHTVTIPYQRAFIAFHEGQELLVVQSNFKGAPEKFGWVIPVPSQPTVSSISPGRSEALFDDLYFATRIKIIPLQAALSKFGAVAMAACLTIFIIMALTHLITNTRWNWTISVPIILTYLCTAFICAVFVMSIWTTSTYYGQHPETDEYLWMIAGLLALLFPLAMTWPVIHLARKVRLQNAICSLLGILFIAPPVIAFSLFHTTEEQVEKSYPGVSALSVEELASGKAGIYDYKVIKSTSSADLVAWFNENNFAFGERDMKVFDDYIAKDWCFVVARMNSAKADIRKNYEYGSFLQPDPLILLFKTAQAVYPLALTGQNNSDTEVALYFVSEHVLECDARFNKQYSSNKKYIVDLLLQYLPKETQAFLVTIPEDAYVTMYSATLKPADMDRDLIMQDAEDDGEFNTVRYIWF